MSKEKLYNYKELQLEFLGACSQYQLPRDYVKIITSSLEGWEISEKEEILRDECAKISAKNTIPQQIEKIAESRSVIVGLLRTLLLNNRATKKSIDL